MPDDQDKVLLQSTCSAPGNFSSGPQRAHLWITASTKISIQHPSSCACLLDIKSALSRAPGAKTGPRWLLNGLMPSKSCRLVGCYYVAGRFLGAPFSLATPNMVMALLQNSTASLPAFGGTAVRSLRYGQKDFDRSDSRDS